MAELYSLPDGWKWKKLGELTEVNIGKTPSRSKSEYFLGNKIWLSIRDLKSDYISDSNEKITDEAIKTSNMKVIPKGTLLMSFKLTLGKTAFADCDLYTNEAIASLPIKNENVIDKYFLKYSINVIDLEKEVDNAVKGKTLNKEKIKNLDIPLPPLEEQKRIVVNLDNLFAKIDKAIDLHQKNIDEADIFMASVLNDVFVELEEKYEKKQLNQIVIFGGKNISTLEYPNLIYFSLEDIETQTGKILNYKTVNESRVKGTAVSFDDNVVLYSKLRPYLNKVIVPNLEGCATTELVVLKPKDKLDKYFLASYLRSSNIVSFLNNDSMGAKMPRTNMKTFRNLDIPLPPLQNQQKVVAYLDEISNKMEKIKQIQKEKMQSLKELKASILDKAFKGEL